MWCRNGSATKTTTMNTATKITKGTKIESHNMVMVVVGESETAYIGYHEYKGRAVGQCSILKEMFTNPHYIGGIKIINPA